MESTAINFHHSMSAPQQPPTLPTSPPASVDSSDILSQTCALAWYTTTASHYITEPYPAGLFYCPCEFVVSLSTSLCYTQDKCLSKPATKSTTPAHDLSFYSGSRQLRPTPPKNPFTSLHFRLNTYQSTPHNPSTFAPPRLPVPTNTTHRCTRWCRRLSANNN